MERLEDEFFDFIRNSNTSVFDANQNFSFLVFQQLRRCSQNNFTLEDDN